MVWLQLEDTLEKLSASFWSYALCVDKADQILEKVDHITVSQSVPLQTVNQ